MNLEIFVEWFKRQGHSVIKSEKSYWYDQGPRVLQAIPYHCLIQPSSKELKNLLTSSHILGLRYSAPFDSSIGQVSYHAILDNKSYSLSDLGKWARKNVRRGLRSCIVEPITFKELANEGWHLQLDTLDRQGRKLRIEKEQWINRCLAAEDLDGFEAWGAKVDGKLAASVITFQLNNYAYMLYQQCLRDYLSLHVNNALSFTVSQNLISRQNIDCILYGLHSLDAPASVDEFKFRMGYRPEPVRQVVEFNPYLRPFVNPISQKIIKYTLRLLPENSTLSKTEGMLRFYLQGRLPLNQQTWPDVLSSDQPGEKIL
jgi:hypothetical protein